MSDSETAQPNPEGDPTAAGPADGLTQPSPVGDIHADGNSHGPDATTDADASRLSQLSHGLRGRTAIWAAIAVLCVAAGVVASILGANAVSSDRATESREDFAQSSASIASALKLAVQREEELNVSASTFYAHNPNGTPAEFRSWVRWARTARRFPELRNLGLVALVREPQLPTFVKQVSGRTVKVAAGKPVTPAAVGLAIVPPTNHHYFCLTVAELARTRADAAPAGKDYCAAGPALLLARDAGVATYATVSAAGDHGLEEVLPVYRGNAIPRSVFGRTAASVGWLRTVIVPSAMLAQVLRGHPNNAVSVSYHAGVTHATFVSGTPQPDAQSATVSLHNGWTVSAFGPPTQTHLFSDGTAVALLIVGIALSLALGVLVFMLGSGRRRRAAAKTKEVPDIDLYDTLTGLPNKSLTLDRAERMVARAKRQSGMLAGALFIDIDWFKDVNSKLGEAAGDQLLTIVAERLEQVVRAGDTVGRLGGDEFVVLVESAARGVRLDSLARRIIESLHKPVELDGFGPSFYATASIGVAFGRYDTPEDLLRDAQLALHAAKAAGKDRYTLFNANMRSVIESRSVLEAELNTALADHQFFLLYEPVFELSSHRVVGLEALVRWQHPKRGILAPDEFMALAEDTGLSVPIGRWALEEACNRAAAWNVAGHRVGITVKVSANQLDRDGFETDVRRALQQSGVEPMLLTLEIAETTVMRELAAASARLQEIKQLGVRIAIGDFGGSGYARHSDLQRMPLDFLKVDRNSLAASDDEDYRSWLLEAILVVGRDLNLVVIATDIETKEQLAALQVMGCTTAQGPFLGRPIPADAVVTLLTGGAQQPPQPGPPQAPPAPQAPVPAGAGAPTAAAQPPAVAPQAVATPPQTPADAQQTPGAQQAPAQPQPLAQRMTAPHPATQQRPSQAQGEGTRQPPKPPTTPNPYN